MRKHNSKKLSLDTTTLRNLDTVILDAVAGAVKSDAISGCCTRSGFASCGQYCPK